MKTLQCSPRREEEQTTLYRSGGFAYEYIADYAKDLPEEVAGAVIAGGCTDREGSLYLAMRGQPSRIVQLDPRGVYVRSFGQGLLGDYLHFIRCTPQGTILCVDSNNHVVRELTMEGELVRDFGTYGRPSDTGMDNGYYARTRRSGGVFPTEPYQGIPAVWAMTEAMRRVHRVGEPFNMPCDAAVNAKGELLVADGYGNRAVHKFAPDGTLRKTWGGVGSWENRRPEPGKFLVVHALAVDARDQVWVCDREGDAVHIFDGDGNLLGYCGGNLGQPSGVDTDGSFVYVAGRAGYLTVFDLDLKVVAQLGSFNCDLRAHGLCADRTGNLYLFPTHSNPDHQVIQLRREDRPEAK